MTPWEIAIIVVVAVAFAAAVGTIIYRKVKHKGGCDCGCSGCPHACHCKDGAQKDKNN
ncbi:MAG: FeoB-associated Cys-rich membrane protein [Clostridia bacterium]|nr:FeoB-associated Cys-rich membrane protein [Clostridia bacterium]